MNVVFILLFNLSFTLGKLPLWHHSEQHYSWDASGADTDRNRLEADGMLPANYAVMALLPDSSKGVKTALFGHINMANHLTQKPTCYGASTNVISFVTNVYFLWEHRRQAATRQIVVHQ